MNSQDITVYILIGVGVIGCAYFSWASRKKNKSTNEHNEVRDQ